MMTNLELKLTRQVRLLLIVFMIGLVLSGISSFPIQTQLEMADEIIQQQRWQNDFTIWIERVYGGLKETNLKYPFISYGTDWLGFAHLIIAVLFIGPLRDPLKNIWVIQFGLLACIGIFPLAFIAGPIRGIPWFWTLIDCSFGVFGGIIMWACYTKAKQLESISKNQTS